MTRPRPATILLIEDNQMDALRTIQALNETHFLNEVRCVSRAEDAQQLLLSGEQFDLILLDLSLPGMSGQEFLSWVKAEPELRRTPVVVLSSSEADQDIARAYDTGVSAYLVKPVSLAKLTESVSTLGVFYFEMVVLPPNDGQPS
ncbi:MAG: response regulator [Actinobacteria bacterium]|nr:response regulator [Actinomycetota bacterium]